jgi:hypothetical protein
MLLLIELTKKKYMNNDVLIGIILLTISFLVLFKAIKHPGKGTVLNINTREFLVGFSLLVFGIMYLFKLW